jgi:4-hydroxybenzoate polyprenyltransferase
MKWYELGKGMTWPENSWAFFRLFGNKTTRVIASVSCVVAAVIFIAGGVLIFAKQPVWLWITVIAAAFSSILMILTWDGKMKELANKGLFDILINMAILILLLVVKWPDFGF